MIDLSGFNSDYFDGTFDEEAVYTPAGGQAKSIQVIFDNGYSILPVIGEPGMGDSSPQVLCKTADAGSASHGDTLLVGGTTYYVQEVRPDGTGITTLILSRDA